MSDHRSTSQTRPALRSSAGTLTLRSERDGNGHLIAPEGELDLATAPLLEAELLRVESTDASSIVLDLGGLEFIDSTGLRLIVIADARSRADSCRLSLRRGPPAVQRVFDISGFAALLPFAD